MVVELSRVDNQTVNLRGWRASTEVLPPFMIVQLLPGQSYATSAHQSRISVSSLAHQETLAEMPPAQAPVRRVFVFVIVIDHADASASEGQSEVANQPLDWPDARGFASGSTQSINWRPPES